MGEVKRFNLSLFLSSPLQREAWSQLQMLPAGQRTEYVCRAVCRMKDEKALLESVRAMIREEMAGPPVQQPKEKIQNETSGDIDNGVLDFLRALQDGGDTPDTLF